MDAAQFIDKWKKVALTERSAAQQHFLDLCELVGHPKPAELDPTGESFTFKKGAAKHGGGDGWADVWKRGCFGWESKGKKEDRIVGHTSFTATKHVMHEIPPKGLGRARNRKTCGPSSTSRRR